MSGMIDKLDRMLGNSCGHYIVIPAPEPGSMYVTVDVLNKWTPDQVRGDNKNALASVVLKKKYKAL